MLIQKSDPPSVSTLTPGPHWLPGDYLFPLRMVLGWTYLSAFWRRLILDNKLDESMEGTELLRNRGFDAKRLRFGVPEWNASGLPIETSEENADSTPGKGAGT